MRRDVHPPETMMHFPSVSDFPLFSKKFQTLRKIFTILPFPEKFHLPKFLMTFFYSHRPQISNFPLFSLFQYISASLCFAKFIISPYFDKFSLPVLDKFTCFLHTLRVFCSPLL